MNKAVWLVMASCVMVGGCSWVKLTSGGEKIRVLTPAEVGTCQHIGDTSASSLANVGVINRNEEKVQKELLALARNGAADMGGDTVVPIGEVVDGKQRFAVYKCVGAAAQLAHDDDVVRPRGGG